MSRLSPERVAVRKLRRLAPDYYSLRLGPCSRVRRCRPGRFVHVGLPGRDLFFRRAMSVASVDIDSAELEIIFKVCGRGTTMMSELRRGESVDLLGPLGTGFAGPRKQEICLLVAGGIGFPPLFFLAQDLIAQGRDPKSIEFFYGGRTSGEIVEKSRIRKLGLRFQAVTDDGSYGASGLVTEAVETFLATETDHRFRLYACGPEPMLKAADELALRHGIPGQLALEAPMPCGIGVCLGCVVSLRSGGHARVCADGPVFNVGEVLL